MALDPERFGRLIDPHDGQADVEARQLRVLHERSFEDDPTRMLRAVRFVLRLEFALEPHTAELLARAVRERRAAGLSGARLRNELRVIFHETPARAVAALQRLGLFEAMGLPPASDEACVATARLREAAQALAIDLTTVYPMATCLGIYAALSGQRPAELTARLMLHARSRDALLHAAGAVAQPPRVLLEDASASEIFGDLCRMRPEAALAAWTVLDAEGRARLERYWHELRGTCVEISGTDLIAGGHRPGPGFTGALDAALKAKLDEGADREQQLSIALKALRKPSH
jgi:tRNA nucleotidyltransferase (CCA-adding enzyme)